MILLKKLSPVFALLIFSFCFLECSQKSNTKKELITQQDSLILKNLKEVLWPKAYREQDTLLLDRILDDSFQMIDGSGKTFKKKDEIAWIKKHATKHDSFRYEIKRLDIYKNGTAIVAGTGHIRNDSTYSIYQSSNVLVKRDTVWKAILSHVSGFERIK